MQRGNYFLHTHLRIYDEDHGSSFRNYATINQGQGECKKNENRPDKGILLSGPCGSEDTLMETAAGQYRYQRNRTLRDKNSKQRM